MEQVSFCVGPFHFFADQEWRIPIGGAPFQTVKKAKGFFDKGLAAYRSAGTVRLWRTVPTFAGRDVFSPTYMPPEKMISFYFAVAAAKLYEVF